jgi:hypothetical protein
MVAVGDTANLEMVFDPTSGTLTIYVFGRDATTPMRLNTTTIQLHVMPEGATSPQAATLTAIESASTPAGSQFSAAIPELKGVQRFTGIVRGLPLGGSVAGDIPITFPM